MIKYDGWTVKFAGKGKSWITAHFFYINRNDLLMRLDMSFGDRKRWQKKFGKVGYKIVKVKLVEIKK